MAADLARLHAECKSSKPFVGAKELLRMAKDYGYIKDASRISLADLSAIVLERKLDKDNTTRLSDQWSAPELSEKQATYAALDAVAGLQIHQAMRSSHRPGPLSETATPGSPITLLQNDGKTVVARGVIKESSGGTDHSTTYHGVKLTKSRTAITVESILCPATLASEYKANYSLSSFGPPPFDIVVKRIWLRTAPPESMMATSPILPSESRPSHSVGTDDRDQELAQATTSSYHASETSALQVRDASAEPEGGDPTQDSFEPPNLPTTADHTTPETALRDENSVTLGHEVLSQTNVDLEVSRQKDAQPTLSRKVLSRVLMDPWHAFHRIRISKSHGLRRFFSRAFRDAVFIPDKNDQALVSAYLHSQDSSWEEVLERDAKWLWERCRRTIPPPDELYDAVKTVFNTYRPLKDAKSQDPLFNSAAWEDAKNVLALIKLGLLSDPPGIPLYFRKATDSKTHLPLYRCCRGSNSVEGGVHQNIRRRLPISGVSPRHAATRLKDYVLLHNLVVSDSAASRFGKGIRTPYGLQVDPVTASDMPNLNL